MDTNTSATPLSPAPNPAPMPTPSPEPHTSSWGAIAGSVIIVALLIAGGVYFFLSQEDKQRLGELLVPTQDAQTESLQQTSSSDEVDDLEADLNATSDTNVESEVNNLEQSF